MKEEDARIAAFLNQRAGPDIKSVFDLKDKQHGKSREMPAVALGNMKNPAAADVLIELLSQDEVAGHALSGLGTLNAQQTMPTIERFMNHPKSWVRKAASKALATSPNA